MTKHRLPANVHVRELLPDGVHYILPRRELGKWRTLAAIPLLIGAGMFVGAIAWALVAVATEWARPQPDWFNLISLLMALPLEYGGYTIARFGAFAAFGHAEVKLERHRLRAIERAGLLRWTRHRPINQIDRLEIVSGLSREAARKADPNFCRIQAGELFLAPGYSRQLCRALAEGLRRRWPAALEGAVRLQPPEVVDAMAEPGDGEPAAAAPLPARPAASQVIVDETPDAFSMHIPPAGIIKGSKGLLGFCVLWFGILTFITVIGVLIGAGGEKDFGLMMILAIVGCFWLVGAGLLLVAINMGRRCAVFAIAGDRLLVVQQGLFGKKRREWRCSEIESIGIGPSGMKINDVDILELQIRPRAGKKFGVLAGRDEAELAWMAAALHHRATSLSAPAAAGEMQ